MAELAVRRLGHSIDTDDVSEPIFKVPTASNLQLAPANVDRRGGVISNDSSVKVFVRFGDTAATAVAGGYHVPLAVGEKFLLPEGITEAIQVIGTGSPTGAVVLTEYTE